MSISSLVSSPSRAFMGDADEGERRGLLGIEQGRDQTVGLAVAGRTQCRATPSSKRALDLYSIVSARILAPGHGAGACLIMVKTQAKLTLPPAVCGWQ